MIGEVVEVFSLRRPKFKELLEFFITDETMSGLDLKVTMWEGLARKYSGLKKGDIIELKSVLVKSFRGEVSLSVSEWGSQVTLF